MATAISIGVEPSAVQKHKPECAWLRRGQEVMKTILKPALAHSVPRLDAHGKPSQAVRWMRPADAQPADYLYAPPPGLTDAEQIAWCKEHWQGVLIVGEDKKWKSGEDCKRESAWLYEPAWPHFHADGKSIREPQVYDRLRGAFDLGMYSAAVLTEASSILGDGQEHYKHDPNIDVHFDKHQHNWKRYRPSVPDNAEDHGALMLLVPSQHRYQPQDPVHLLGLRTDAEGHIGSIKAVDPLDFCLLDCLSAVARKCPIDFMNWGNYYQGAYSSVKERPRSRELIRIRQVEPAVPSDPYNPFEYGWVYAPSSCIPKSPGGTSHVYPTCQFVINRPVVERAWIKCIKCQLEVERFLRSGRDRVWICPNCDTSEETDVYVKRRTLFFDDPYDKMILPPFPERDQERVDTIVDFWRKLRTKMSFTKKDLLEDPDFWEDVREYEVIFEGQILGDQKDKRGRRRRAMQKELQHICPKNVCPNNCCQLDGEDSAFTHAFYAATTTDETRLQVCRGGFFAIVIRDVYRIYSLGPLGTAHDVIDEVYDKLWEELKDEAIRAARKKAKRDGLGVRDTQQAEIDAATRADRAFEDGIIHEVQPADPSTVCPTCGKPLTGFFTFHDEGLDNSAVTA